MRRNLGQLSFADGLANQRRGRNEWLDEVSKFIDWPAIEDLLSPVYARKEGRPSYPVLTLVKLLLLQQWYSLSDPGLEEAVDDRLSFRRFAGIPLDQGVPDHATIWRFRQQLVDLSLHEKLFEEILAQIDRRGLIVREGTLIDASLIKSAARPPRAKEGTVSARDPDASWTVKNKKSHFGYKAHVGTDQGSDIIRTAKLTSADIHDSLVAYELVSGDERALYADKAYDSKDFRDKLKEAGIDDRVLFKAKRNTPLKEWQETFNKAASAIRGGVERCFAIMKRHYRFTQMSYLGLARNSCKLHLICCAMNIRRALVLSA